jgi:bifunctional non-homologous end joining protein LigD
MKHRKPDLSRPCWRVWASALRSPRSGLVSRDQARRLPDPHRRGRSVRLLTRNGHDLADRFPLVAEAIEALPVRSCVVDGEAIVCDDEGLPVFDLIRGHATDAGAVLCAFDLLEVNGEDVRREPIEDRKRRLAGPVRLQHDGMALNEAFSGDGTVIYKHACALGCEGIVSKRIGSSIAPAARRTG